jgi:hypothetical protein
LCSSAWQPEHRNFIELLATSGVVAGKEASMADLTVQDLSDEDGAAVSFASAAGGGDKFVWSNQTFIIISNTDSGSHTVTVTPAYAEIDDGQNGELTRSSIVLAVAAGAVAIIPPLPVPFRSGSDGKVSLTYEAVTGVKVAAARLR